MAEEYLTRRQLAERFRMTEEAIRGLMRRRHLKLGQHYYKPTPHVLRFRWSACERWLTARPVPEAEPEAPTEVSKEELRELLAEAAQQLAKEGSR